MSCSTPFGLILTWVRVVETARAREAAAGSGAFAECVRPTPRAYCWYSIDRARAGGCMRCWPPSPLSAAAAAVEPGVSTRQHYTPQVRGAIISEDKTLQSRARGHTTHDDLCDVLHSAAPRTPPKVQKVKQEREKNFLKKNKKNDGRSFSSDE